MVFGLAIFLAITTVWHGIRSGPSSGYKASSAFCSARRFSSSGGRPAARTAAIARPMDGLQGRFAVFLDAESVEYTEVFLAAPVPGHYYYIGVMAVVTWAGGVPTYNGQMFILCEIRWGKSPAWGVTGSCRAPTLREAIR